MTSSKANALRKVCSGTCSQEETRVKFSQDQEIIKAVLVTAIMLTLCHPLTLGGCTCLVPTLHGTMSGCDLGR